MTLDAPEWVLHYWEIDDWDEAVLLAKILGHHILSHTIWESRNVPGFYLARGEHGAIEKLAHSRLCSWCVDWLTRDRVRPQSASSATFQET